MKLLVLLGQIRSGTTALGRWCCTALGYRLAPAQEARVLAPNMKEHIDDLQPAGYNPKRWTDAHQTEQYGIMDRAMKSSDTGIVIRAPAKWSTVAARYCRDREAELLVALREPALIVYSRERKGWGNPATQLGFKDTAYGQLRFSCWMQWTVFPYLLRLAGGVKVCIDNVTDEPAILLHALESLGYTITQRGILSDRDRRKREKVREYGKEPRVQQLREWQEHIASKEDLPDAQTPAQLRRQA